GFSSLSDFLDRLLSSKDQQTAALVSRYISNSGRELLEHIQRRQPTLVGEWTLEQLVNTLQHEGESLKLLLSRDQRTTITSLLEGFSMKELMEEIEVVAPTLLSVLQGVAMPGETADEARKPGQRNVFSTISCMLAFCRSQKASNFAIILGLYLLAAGASKREIQVLAHAGLCLSYTSILEHVKKLSAEGTQCYIKEAHRNACSIVWANLNIAFRVSQQRIENMNHFDNGTTATLIPIFDPSTQKNLPWGALPHSLKLPRETRRPIFDFTPESVLPTGDVTKQLRNNCLYQLKRMAVENVASLARFKGPLGKAPEVKKIPLHRTEQFPLPAMSIDESSIEGTVKVIQQILSELKMTEDDMQELGLLFVDGDLLTMNLLDKVEGNRRFSKDFKEAIQYTVRRLGLFHTKLALARLTVIEHYGKPNSKWAGGLWWENAVLGWKPQVVGWKGAKATPWKPSHELLHISLPAHVIDGLRIHCGKDNFDAWTKECSFHEFESVANETFNKLFSTHAFDEQKDRPDGIQDQTFENSILYNRDALLYIEFVAAIKCGDIGRVVNTLRVYVVMMRGVGSMPKYADAVFETLGQLDKYPENLREIFLANWLVNMTGRKDGFKEVDLLQEHQNFWAKVIYNAKGTNKSWAWLSMITVCIFTLRDAMRTVQAAFEIPAYGTRHTNPKITEEIDLLCKRLRENKIQSYIANREGNDEIPASRDVLELGSAYCNGAKAYANFRKDPRIIINEGIKENAEDNDDSMETPGDDSESISDVGDFGDVCVDDDDLAVDEEEF
ncbi:hypothetical protein BD410DRAFT_684999, partial [Rickenella mellea]